MEFDYDEEMVKKCLDLGREILGDDKKARKFFEGYISFLRTTVNFPIESFEGYISFLRTTVNFPIERIRALKDPELEKKLAYNVAINIILNFGEFDREAFEKSLSEGLQQIKGGDLRKCPS